MDRFRPFRFLFLAVAVLGGMLHATPASAHKLFLFATVRGRLIEGEVYYHGGDPASSVSVSMVDPDGNKLSETTTDDEGRFSFEPRACADHRLVADAGMGHQVEYTVPRDELPRDLPARSPGESSDRSNAEPSAKPDRQASSPSTHDHNHEHQAVDTEALGQQIAALRRDLDQWKAQLRFQDVLGGLGYILGLMGLAFYFLGIRRKEKRASAGK